MRTRSAALLCGLASLTGALQPGYAEPLLEAQGHMYRWGPAATATNVDRAPQRISYFALDAAFEAPQDSPRLSASNCGRMRAFRDIVRTSQQLTPRAANGELHAALAAWQTAAGIEFIEAPDAAHANIVIGASADATGKAFANLTYDRQFLIDPTEKALGTPGNPLLGPRPVPQSSVAALDNGGVTLVPITQAYVCLNPMTPWKIGFDGNTAIYDLRLTFEHEIGHAIGLDHPGRTGSIMAYRYDETVRDLTPLDIAAAQMLYGPPRTDRLAAQRGIARELPTLSSP